MSIMSANTNLVCSSRAILCVCVCVFVALQCRCAHQMCVHALGEPVCCTQSDVAGRIGKTFKQKIYEGVEKHRLIYEWFQVILAQILDDPVVAVRLVADGVRVLVQ